MSIRTEIAPALPADAVAAARDAILKSLRDRRLLKYLFAEDPDSRAAYGYVEAPIDLDTQHECAEDLARLAIAAYLSSQAEPTPDPAEPVDWRSAPARGLEAAIDRFKADLPGWWFSLGECQVSCDASCAPTQESEHIALLGTDDRFDSGFDADLTQPSTLALALDDVRTLALAAIKAGAARPAAKSPDGGGSKT